MTGRHFRTLWALLLAGCTLEAPLEPDEAPAAEEETLVTGVAVPPGTTVVTLSFSDGTKSQQKAVDLMARLGLRATFHISSGRIGTTSRYFTVADLQAIADAGHEIAGHTVNHVDLDEVSESVARREICDDRVRLMGWGFPVTTFAYPSSTWTPTAERIVRECNYNSARETGGIRNPYGCRSCPAAETIPPPNVYRIRTPASAQSTWTLGDLQSLVLQAEAAGGGWIIVSLHEICDGCGTYSTPEALLRDFLTWLAPRASRGTVVLTMQDVIGGEVKPPVQSDGGTPDAGAPDAGAPIGIPLRNPSLETDSNGDNVPDCWKRLNSGTQTGGWLRTTDARTGSWAQRARISSYTRGDRRLVVLQDTGACAPAAAPGQSYRVSAWYKTDAPAVFVAAYRTASGWVPWATGPELPRSPTGYVRGEWVTPPVPAGATHLSVGLSLRGVGFLFMDDFSLEQVP